MKKYPFAWEKKIFSEAAGGKPNIKFSLSLGHWRFVLQIRLHLPVRILPTHPVSH